jgi:membrane protein YdbS with pleckstrin-like domain
VKQHVDRASRWIYSGIWAAVVQWFRVPEEPPTIPGGSAAAARSFRPAEGFLRYLKFYFWIVLVLIDATIFFLWLTIAVAWPVAGVLLALPALAIAVAPDVIAYVAIHLRYDTTWYVVSDRSLRIRRGIWLLHETTITYENIQNIRVTQGPLQRWYGIGNVLVETAGGGSVGKEGGISLMHRGLIEGVDNASEIRDLILGHLRKTRTAGLGDEMAWTERGTVPFYSADSVRPSQRWCPDSPRWSAEQLAILREIREAARELVRG